MDCRKITPEFAVTGQLSSPDMTLVHALGYRSVICNRPDGEADDQPLFESIERAAKLSALEAHYLPVPASGPTSEQVARLSELWDKLPKPVLAYCRSGARSAALFAAFSQAQNIA